MIPPIPPEVKPLQLGAANPYEAPQFAADARRSGVLEILPRSELDGFFISDKGRGQ
jgi:hypothetical protein